MPRFLTGEGPDDGEVIEGSLRRDLWMDPLDRRWERHRLSEAEVMDLALEARRAVRPG